MNHDTATTIMHLSYDAEHRFLLADEAPPCRLQRLAGARPGDFSKVLIHEAPDFGGETLWIELTDTTDPERWIGSIANHPVCGDELVYGDLVSVHPADSYGLISAAEM